MGTNRIIWLPAAPGALWYDGDSIFVPRIDYLTEPPPNEFEKTGIARWIRKYHRVIDRWHYPGDHWHGDAEDFAGLSDKSKYFLPGVVPLACPPERLFGFFVFGAIVGANPVEMEPAMRFGINVVNRYETARPGYKFGMTVLPKKEVAKPAVKFGLRVLKKDDVGRPALAFGLRLFDGAPPLRPGFNMGLRVDGKPRPSQLVKPAFRFGLDVNANPPATSVIKPAFRFGLDVNAKPPATEIVKPAFRFGLDVNGNPPATEIVKPAFRFGLDVNGNPPATEIVKPAFRFGLEVEDNTPPPTPGTSCPTAAVLSIGVAYTYSIAANETQWFVVAKPQGMQVTVTFHKNSGSYFGANTRTAVACASPGSSVFHTENDWDYDYSGSGNPLNCYLSVFGDFMAGGNYTIEFTT